MFVQTEVTPNPNSLKFLPGRNVSNSGSFEVTKKEDTDSELVRNLLSINGVIGVFLGVDFLSINKKDNFVILEVGSNKPGEIEPLSKLIKPDIAVVTNIGYAHIEGFKNLSNTAKEKFSLFKHIQKNGYAIINNQDKFRNIVKKRNKIYFGYSQNYYNKIKKILLKKKKNKILIK